jgi:hypothetical protein
VTVGTGVHQASAIERGATRVQDRRNVRQRAHDLALGLFVRADELSKQPGLLANLKVLLGEALSGAGIAGGILDYPCQKAELERVDGKTRAPP